MTDVATAPPQKKPGPNLAVSLIVLVLGAALAGLGGTEGVTKIVHAVTSPVVTTPADLHRHLGRGTYEIYVSNDVLASISPSQVTVTASDGQRIAVTQQGAVSETLSRGSHSYSGEVTFKITNSGDYDVRVGGPSGVPFVLSNSLGDLARHAGAWFALMGIGILVGIVGLILLLVGVVRRHRWRNPRPPAYQTQPPYQTQQPYQPVAASPAAGWYPDPSIPGTSRWWDGTRWTDQTHQT